MAKKVLGRIVLVMSLLGVLMLVLLAVGWSVGANTLWGSLEEFDQNDSAVPATTPQQIHIAYGSSPSEMLISWSTNANQEEGDSGNTQSLVYYGKHQQVVAGEGGNSTTEGSSRQTSIMEANDVSFTLDNPNGAQWVHRARLTLEEGSGYWYRVRTGNSLSPLYSFRTAKKGNQWETKFLVYGDMGLRGGAPILPYLKDEISRGDIDAVIHAGDFAYDLQEDGGRIGDLFMRRIEPIAARIPYMTCVGNHEIEQGTFAHYRYRFTMPNTNISGDPLKDTMWYSWDISNIHFVVYSTQHGSDPGQRAWLENNLIQANANRRERPWIIAVGHKPQYCSNWDEECADGNQMQREFEELFHQYGVDLVIEAHMHSYERMWPVYRGRPTAFDYNNPKSAVHIITGAAGCNEQLGWCVNMVDHPHGPWSAYRMWFPGTYSYSRMKVYNDTHLEWQQVLVLTGEVVDSMMLVQNNHGPFGPIEVYPDAPEMGWDMGEELLWGISGTGAGLLLCIGCGGVAFLIFVIRRKRKQTTLEQEVEEMYEL